MTKHYLTIWKKKEKKSEADENNNELSEAFVSYSEKKIKLTLIYVLQVDAGLVAMVTDHLHSPLLSSPPSHHSSDRDVFLVSWLLDN